MSVLPTCSALGAINHLVPQFLLGARTQVNRRAGIPDFRANTGVARAPLNAAP